LQASPPEGATIRRVFRKVVLRPEGADIIRRSDKNPLTSLP
jgi:hypothetical protein